MNLCVYLGSNFGTRLVYRQAVEALGEAVVRRGWNLVYGGSNKGLMGVLADVCLKGGVRVVGVIPRKLADLGAAKEDLTELLVVEGIHERKAKMASLSDAFLAFPGGIGTFEEVLEVSAWNQLGYHRKPVGFLNVEGYFGDLENQLKHAVTEGFLAPELMDAMRFDADLNRLLDYLASDPPSLPESKWFNA